MKKRISTLFSLLLCFAVLITSAGCSKQDEPDQETGDGSLPPVDFSDPTANGVTLSEREARKLSYQLNPSNETNEGELPKAPAYAVTSSGSSVTMQSKEFTLRFVNQNGCYSLSASSEQSEYVSAKPIIVTIFSSTADPEEVKAEYTSVTITDYGCLATGIVTGKNGSSFTVEDRYYYPVELQSAAINVRRTLVVNSRHEWDFGYATSYLLNLKSPDKNVSYFVPHTVYNQLDATGRTGVFAETELGLPMVSMMSEEGFALSLARYQPIINPKKNFTASLEVAEKMGEANQPGMRVDYPSGKLSRNFFSTLSQKQVVFDLSLSGSQCEDYNDMMVTSFNNHFLLQDQRIVDTDIDKVLDAICQDYKTFLRGTDRNGMVFYGLPWRVTLENGLIGDKSYQAGFVGQQVPAGYQMLFYGIQANDEVSRQNGLNVLNSWIDAGMMNPSGVPKIWIDGYHNTFIKYPTFLRMAIDTMEAYLDAYLLAKENNIECSAWEDALLSFADFLVKAQNDDGSFYRCYSWSGKMYEADDDGIPEPGGNICQSSSKENTAMAVRFLAEMYKHMGKEEYKTAATRAGEYVYDNLYSRGYYVGGTCDNANVVDKEAGVFAMYCYDAMYMLTQDEKWIAPLKQATAFTMSMVQCFSFPAGSNSTLKAATGIKAGYNDGSSFITAEMNGIDNFAAVIYYHLFRLYVITGEPVYFYQAEFMQQNSKSLMDWDGALGYAYRSLTPEASTIADFNFHSATDGEGVMGVWLPWQSVANAAPICDMLLTFGKADVADFADIPVEELYQKLFPKN
jgi:hypothetical protein